MTQQLLTIDQACARLGVSRWTIYKLFEEGAIRRVKLGPRTARIPVADLDAYVESCATPIRTAADEADDLDRLYAEDPD